jgi:hypothetical protein
MSARPSLDDSSHEYNRITLGADFKSQICSQIADSTESLPQWNNDSHRDQIQDAAEGASQSANGTDSSAAKSAIPDTSDVATPLPKDDPLDAAGAKTDERGHPLSQVETARDESEEGKKARPSGIRRLTTQIKRTISRTQK